MNTIANAENILTDDKIIGRKLRIGYVCLDDITSEKTWSGTPHSILAAMRSRNDISIVVVGPLRQYFRWLYLPLIIASKITSRQYAWSRTPRSLRYFAGQIEKQFDREHLDVLFASSSIPLSSIRPGIPVVFWTDALMQDISAYYSIHTANNNQSCRQEVQSIQRADFACYSSNWSAMSAQAYTNADTVKVLHFGPNIEIKHALQDVRRWIAERCERHKNQCRLLFIGKDWARKGGSVAVETARILNESGLNTKLALVGARPIGMLPEYVESIGFVDKSNKYGETQMYDLLRTSDILLLPSRAEASAIVIAEAAAFGLPVLTCDTGGLSDYVTNGLNGYRLPIHDAGPGFAQKTKIILANYERYALHAYDEYRNKLNYETSIGKLIELFKHAMLNMGHRP